MDYDQALRIACFYGMVQAVESLLWMEADPQVVCLNKKDRGTEFHIRVCQTVRDGIRVLVAEALQEDGYGGSSPSSVEDDDRAKVVTAAKAAARAWLLEDETTGKDLSETSSSTSAETASTSTTATAVARQWSVNSGSMSSDSDGRGKSSGGARARARGCGSGVSSSGSSSDSSSVDNSMDYEGHSSRSGNSATNSNPESDEEDDVFVLPALDSLDQELNICRTPPRSPVDVSAAEKWRWTERGRESVRTKANNSRPDGHGHLPKSSSPKANRGNPTTLGAVKDRARATLAGVMKWATSPRNSRSPKNSRGVRTPSRSPPRGRSPITGRGVVVGA